MSATVTDIRSIRSGEVRQADIFADDAPARWHDRSGSGVSSHVCVLGPDAAAAFPAGELRVAICRPHVLHDPETWIAYLPAHAGRVPLESQSRGQAKAEALRLALRALMKAARQAEALLSRMEKRQA